MGHAMPTRWDALLKKVDQERMYAKSQNLSYGMLVQDFDDEWELVNGDFDGALAFLRHRGCTLLKYEDPDVFLLRFYNN
jgi:hypothetical protein